ncbi:HTH-type transcriptional regulator ImmR [Ruminiclostridium hungatei]|uniref:HTH-type transcriptional regulator ImmR n=1 Tax=Ruminiclostridium hungatei TaxID=48256 RepID=A0A1V4SG54_RUMHU|nr:helix-turn-helix transcriptional regulator [Ruminiclostridium hungatei]OPX42455.1 HTH-type transcriptional regulator ImmR [Ruminiclostridium hungatei]
MNIGENLKYLRIQRNMTQKEIAKILGVATNTYTQYETNYRQPDIGTLVKLADYYMISLDILVGRMKFTA